MSGKKIFSIVLIFVPFGLVVGFGYWIYLYLQSPEDAPTFGDLLGTLKSYFSRGVLIVKGKIEGAVGLADARTLAASFIASVEGYSAKAYADPSGQFETYSIGYGHQILPEDGLTNDAHIDEAMALQLLSDDLDKFVGCVESVVTVDISPEQEAALISLCYNIGCGAFQNSTLVRYLNAGNYEAAQEQFSVWNKAGGSISSALVSRRQQESDLFGSTNSTEVQS